MRKFPAQREREEDQETAEVVKNMILLREESMKLVLTGREGGWNKRPTDEPVRKVLGRPGKAQDEATSPTPSGKKTPSLAEMARRAAAMKPVDKQGLAVQAKSHETIKQGSGQQTYQQNMPM
ncbi:Vegetative incompatibility protein HET-E-1 [Ceratocystis lukuohia]|uniref:Vegetative incompatibility protein HET-E-1 n=1 Tax=Ceratocystis lukuohia TaxID=2019550 RepID=A0ABR4MQI9_9PEZI